MLNWCPCSSSILIEVQIGYLLAELMAGLQTEEVSLMCVSKVSLRKKNVKVDLTVSGSGNMKMNFYRKLQCSTR